MLYQEKVTATTSGKSGALMQRRRSKIVAVTLHRGWFRRDETFY
jgi:hypothetical protein